MYMAHVLGLLEDADGEVWRKRCLNDFLLPPKQLVSKSQRLMVGLYLVVHPAGSNSEWKSCRCKPIHKTMASLLWKWLHWWHPLHWCLLGLEHWCVAQALLSFVSDCHGDGGAGGFGTGGRGLWASTATPRHCGYLLCLMPNVASQLPAISVACGPQLPSRTTKQSVYQASPGSHRQMGGTPTVAATRAWAGAVRAISLLFAFAPASGSASFGMRQPAQRSTADR